LVPASGIRIVGSRPGAAGHVGIVGLIGVGLIGEV
jgi:hypothetical protein